LGLIEKPKLKDADKQWAKDLVSEFVLVVRKNSSKKLLNNPNQAYLFLLHQFDFQDKIPICEY